MRGFISQLLLTVPQCYARVAFREGNTDIISCLLSSLCPHPGLLKASAPEAAHLQHLRQPDGPQPQCQPLQSSQSIKGMNQRVVTLAQHISVINLVLAFLLGLGGGGKGWYETCLVGKGWE